MSMNSNAGLLGSYLSFSQFWEDHHLKFKPCLDLVHKGELNFIALFQDGNC